jgi:hypothetical protein
MINREEDLLELFTILSGRRPHGATKAEIKEITGWGDKRFYRTWDDLTSILHPDGGFVWIPDGRRVVYMMTNDEHELMKAAEWAYRKAQRSMEKLGYTMPTWEQMLASQDDSED